jgi:colanic acid/amylovoran biosynthesis glycosyltransferase
MTRILHLFNIFGAATEKAMLDYTVALAGDGWELTAGYETLAENAPPTPFPRVKLARVCVEPTADIPAQMDRVAAAPKCAAHRNLLDESFDLVHGHFGPRILQGAAWLTRRVPMVVSIYGYDATRLSRDPCWIERYRWAADHGATFVTLAQSMANRLVALGVPGNRVRLIRLGVALDEHCYDPQPAPREHRFVFIGRLVEKKGAEFVIRAMEQLASTHMGPAVVEMIGSGPLETPLRQLVDDLRIWDRVRFVGAVPFSELFDRLRGATALVQPSVVAADGDSEGAPMVLMHAQAAGVPCITTAHAGNPEVLPPEARGFVVPERDPAALARAMASMIGLGESARAALQETGRAWIAMHYDLRQTSKGYGDLYRELLAANTARRRDVA